MQLHRDLANDESLVRGNTASYSLDDATDTAPAVGVNKIGLREIANAPIKADK
jgi:hypothetical protein